MLRRADKLKSSLGRVANNPGLRDSDGYGTYQNAVNNEKNAYSYYAQQAQRRATLGTNTNRLAQDQYWSKKRYNDAVKTRESLEKYKNKKKGKRALTSQLNLNSLPY